MNQNLIDSIVKITGKEESEIEEKLESISVDDMYTLIDMVRNNSESEIKTMFESFIAPYTAKSKSFDVIVKIGDHITKDGILDWLDDNSIGYVLHPSDVVVIKSNSSAGEIKVKRELGNMTRSDTKNIRVLNDSSSSRTPSYIIPPVSTVKYTPDVTPNKRTISNKSDITNMNNKFFEGKPSTRKTELVGEGIMGMTNMASMLPRLMTLAGLNKEDTGMNEIPSTIPVLSSDVGDDSDEICDQTDELTNESADTENIKIIRDAFDQVILQMEEIRLSEFQEVRALMSNLMSHIDRMANSITTK